MLAGSDRAGSTGNLIAENPFTASESRSCKLGSQVQHLAMAAQQIVGAAIGFDG